MEPMPEGFLDPIAYNSWPDSLIAPTHGDFDPQIAAEFGGAPESISTLMNNDISHSDGFRIRSICYFRHD